MIFPPALIRMMVVRQGGRKVNLWIPFILLWPLILLAFVIVTLVSMIYLAIKPRPGAGSPLGFGYCLYSAICAFKGLNIRVRNEMDNIHITFY